ncbi:unnamed protein product [Xylocopa violacea]|uniref:Uncharacterized protein n=1 Tax=Xylocopa violacea TaxID=135666 RepID=A0ABP1N7G8_XYLVO
MEPQNQEIVASGSPAEVPNDPGKMFIGGLSWQTSPGKQRRRHSSFYSINARTSLKMRGGTSDATDGGKKLFEINGRRRRKIKKREKRVGKMRNSWRRNLVRSKKLDFDVGWWIRTARVSPIGKAENGGPFLKQWPSFVRSLRPQKA